MSENRNPPVLQIYFTIGGQDKKPSAHLNGVVSSTRDKLQSDLGDEVEILQIGINDCTFEGCSNGCKNAISTDGKNVIWEGKLF
jgi:hypothetical protein